MGEFTAPAVIFQHIANSAVLWGHYSLLALAFYFASIGCRHFTFCTGVGFLVAPYVALSIAREGAPPVAVLAGLVAASVFGLLYREFSAWLYTRGARAGQLLLVSLATLAIGQNGLTLIFGSTSQRFPIGSGVLRRLGSLAIGYPELVHLLAAVAVSLGSILLWHRSLLVRALRALVESRTGLRLRGYRIEWLERITSVIGFGIGGLAGTLWSWDTRVRPSMGFDASLIGVVCFLVGPYLAGGPVGLVMAACGIVLVRLPLVLFLEDDWSMAATMILLIIALAVRRGAALIGPKRA